MPPDTYHRQKCWPLIMCGLHLRYNGYITTITLNKQRNEGIHRVSYPVIASVSSSSVHLSGAVNDSHEALVCISSGGRCIGPEPILSCVPKRIFLKIVACATKPTSPKQIIPLHMNGYDLPLKLSFQLLDWHLYSNQHLLHVRRLFFFPVKLLYLELNALVQVNGFFMQECHGTMTIHFTNNLCLSRNGKINNDYIFL